jgi:CRP/FNR family transcriptional regulator
MTLNQLIERTPALVGVDAAVIQRLAERATLRNLRRGELLWQAGDPPAFWAIIRSGLFKIVRRAPHGRTAICGLLGPPSSLGDLSALRGVAYSADVVAASSVASVLIIPRDVLMECVRVFPTLGLSFACQAHARLVALEDKIDVLSAGGVEARLAAALLKLYEQLGDDFEDGTSSVPVALSRRELADLVSTSVETVIRVMTRWEREGLLSTEVQGFTLRDLRALRTVAGYPTELAAE